MARDFHQHPIFACHAFNEQSGCPDLESEATNNHEDVKICWTFDCQFFQVLESQWSCVVLGAEGRCPTRGRHLGCKLCLNPGDLCLEQEVENVQWVFYLELESDTL